MDSAYLVICRDDGYGDVHPLTPGQRVILGRASTSSIVLKDDLCSREHAEVSFFQRRMVRPRSRQPQRHAS